MFLLLPIAIYTQNSSVYTRYALGDYAPFFSAKNVALGDASALSDEINVGSSNPAAWNAINLTRVEGGFMFTQSLQEEGALQAKYFGSKFLGIRFAVPVQRDYGIVAALFLEPVTVIDYNVEKKYTSEQFDDYKLKYEGSGGISKIGFGLTYRFPFGLAVGSTFDYYSGGSYYSSTIDFHEFSQYKDATFKLTQTYRGLGFTPGLITNDLSEYFNSEVITGLNFSASMRYIAKVYIDTALVLHSKYDEITTPGSYFVAKVPNVYTFGIKIDFFKTLLVVSDYSFADWTQYNSVNETGTTQKFKWSVGFEYFDRKNKRRTIWQKIPFRFGLSVEKMQYLVQGKDIYAYVASLGMGVPMNEADIIDLALSFGKRGPNDGSLVQEKFMSLGISLSFGEQWFIRKGYK